MYKAADVSTATPPLITWLGGAWAATAQAGALANIASSARSVGWGIEITGEQSLLNAAGHVWVAHVPLNMSVAVPYNLFPVTEAMMAQSPLACKYSLAEVVQDGLIVPGKPFDDGIYRFRDATAAEEKLSTSTAIESTDGWCAIVVMVVANGVTSGTTVVNIEHINHMEYVQNASAGYGFIDALSMPHSEAIIERASRISVASPMLLWRMQWRQ